MDFFHIKIGCLSNNEAVIYQMGKVRKKKDYNLWSTTIERPEQGIGEERLICEHCSQTLFLTVYSHNAVLMKRLSSLGLSLLPLSICAIMAVPGVSKNSFMSGFLLIIFLALIWMIPVFLPKFLKAEHKIALELHSISEDHRHDIFESNVESVSQETFFKY